jgi:putative ABC transport system ATP-binding protein
MLDVSHISKTFNPGTINEKLALCDVSLHLNEGDFTTVIGGNGAGKSTLLNAVAGTWRVDSGSITIGGVNVTQMPEYRRAAYVGRVFQDPMEGTAASMQIEENLALAHRRGSRRTLRRGITERERREYRERLAHFGLGLEDRLTMKVGLLSGGQRQALTCLWQRSNVPRSCFSTSTRQPLTLKQQPRYWRQPIVWWPKTTHDPDDHA